VSKSKSHLANEREDGLALLTLYTKYKQKSRDMTISQTYMEGKKKILSPEKGKR
jgi:hypothetical protein